MKPVPLSAAMPGKTATRNPKVLFFCRGRGRGHAIPDIEIVRELQRLGPEIDLVFASYSTGRTTLMEAGFSVIDLDFPDNVRFLDFMVRATHLILREQPDIVVSHEEFAALPAAKACGLPAVFIVDFFFSAEWMLDSVAYADQILFIERRGIFFEPPTARGRIRYVGPIVRPKSATRADRGRARARLGLAEQAQVVSVIPGAWANEERAPMFDLVLTAFDRLTHDKKKLVWVAGADQPALAARAEKRTDVLVLKECSPIEDLMVASDVVLTKANRGTTIDLASLGIPSISIPWGLNPIDETVIPRIRTNSALNVRAIDPPFLASLLTDVLAQDPATRQPDPEYRPGAARIAAQELSQILRGLPARPTPDSN